MKAELPPILQKARLSAADSEGARDIDKMLGARNEGPEGHFMFQYNHMTALQVKASETACAGWDHISIIAFPLNEKGHPKKPRQPTLREIEEIRDLFFEKWETPFMMIHPRGYDRASVHSHLMAHLLLPHAETAVEIAPNNAPVPLTPGHAEQYYQFYADYIAEKSQGPEDVSAGEVGS